MDILFVTVTVVLTLISVLVGAASGHIPRSERRTRTTVTLARFAILAIFLSAVAIVLAVIAIGLS